MSLFGFWRKHYRDLPRIRTIIAVATRHGFGHLVEQLGLQRFVPVRRRVPAFKKRPVTIDRLTTPQRLRAMFEELGPTFIKLGQVLSCRPDLLPAVYAQELARLTDSVSPFPFEQAREIIEADLGAPLSHLFAQFDPLPAAAASIAQVHRGTLWDGSDVIVKVRRPQIEQIIERDISILQGIADLIEAHVPELRVYNVRGIVDEFARTISREMDFFIEAASAERLRKNFENSDLLYIPRVYSELSTRRVLVLERIEGYRIDDVARLDREGIDRRALTKKGAAAYFQMVLQDGFFHADPHPGNIFVLPGGKPALVDFGMMGRVSEENMERFATIFVALYNRDYGTLAEEYVNMGFLTDETADVDQLQRALKEDLEELLEPYYGMTVRQIDFTRYAEQVTAVLSRHRLRLPQNLYLMDKALITLEGILRQIDPDFDYLEAARPYVSRLVRRTKNPVRTARLMQRNAVEFVDLLRILPKHMKLVMRKLLHGDVQIRIRIEDLGHLIRDLDKSSNRLSFSILTAAIVIASSIVIHADVGIRLFGVPVFGLAGYVVAALLGIWLLIGILRSGQL